MDGHRAFSGFAVVTHCRDDGERDTRSHSATQSSSASLAVRADPVIPSRGPRAVVFRAAKEITRICREDIDILASSHTCDVEGLKEFIVAKNPMHFYLVNAKTPGATWRVLWYHDRGADGELEKTKVDILKPGVLQLPMIFSEAIVDKQGFPVVPMSILLLHKLQGWKDNMESQELRLRLQQDADAGDIRSLLRIVVKGMSMQEQKNSMYWKQFALERFSEEFRDETERRVRLFCFMFPEYRDIWRRLGW
ncbi:uncharacterized protein EV420DRAFT_1580089 [Desarmillaria tabescens]|uniref:Uncharacterized protein n=1 Tax=Armillaria tabescens TaxID=1929756 RepID=A0AA39JHL7_ARMTA|nr:uncharacterized protein EV420DRAFT_1580089 [Desarmillaria tabescens]KAK0441459.1 hypothetical protein EV420DRAFT_1580089 [Desarmillaria tabescens]